MNIPPELYSLKPVRSSLFGRTVFGIYFEDTLVQTTTLSVEEVTRLVFLLNAAYSLGFSSGEIAGELNA